MINQTYKGQEGLVVNISVEINNYEGEQVFICALIDEKDESSQSWKELKASHTFFPEYTIEKNNNLVAISKYELNVRYENSLFSNCELFVPYNTIRHPQGLVNYRLKFYAYNSKNPSFFINNKKTNSYYQYEYFSLNWNSKHQPSIYGVTTEGAILVEHKHTDVDNENSFDIYKYSNNVTISEDHHRCPDCYFCPGKCTWCNGNGYTMGYYGFTPCYACNSTGKCKQCKGTAFVKSIWEYNNFTGDYKSTLFNGTFTWGNVKNERGGYVSSHSSSSDNHSAEQYNYVEEIVYAPNYTGTPTYEYCPICDKVTMKHSHIKKRVP